MDSDDWTEWTNFNSKDILAAYIQGTSSFHWQKYSTFRFHCLNTMKMKLSQL